MEIKRIAKETTKVMISYLTYQAVRTVINQLGETNKPLGFWLHNFSTSERIKDGEAYLKDLLEEHQELAFRIMTVREHLAEEVTEYLPEMVCTGIKQANIETRCRHLERMTQISSSAPETNLDSDLPIEDDTPDDIPAE
ncbi:MAG: chaperonin family protein RbcX [Thermosynechococcaceae cyanobacterium]